MAVVAQQPTGEPVHLEFTLNGSPVEVDLRSDMTMLELLREERGITSVKDGCAPEGSCGACTVLMDGRPIVSCAQLATRAAGHSILTQDGLPEKHREQWAQSFVASGASHCGFCSPGIVMKAEGLLGRNPDPSREAVAHALTGNLCRCTGYVKIIDAVLLAAAARRGQPIPPVDASGRVGSRTARYRGLELALGDKPYVNDLSAPGMLHGAMRYSDHPRATVLRIDVSKALAYPGVECVLTARDVRGDRTQGGIVQDWRQFVAEGETTAYVGTCLPSWPPARDMRRARPPGWSRSTTRCCRP